MTRRPFCQTRSQLPQCPACAGTGEITVQYRAVRATDVSPCDSERYERCRVCSGTGEITEAECGECELTYQLPAEDADPNLDADEDRLIYTCQACRALDAAGERIPNVNEDGGDR